MYAVILAGGGGTRLWPLSRPDRPKPFLPLLGDETLLQRTVARLAPLIPPEDVYVVTDRRYGGLVRLQVPGARLIVEPMGRNTAAAVALAVAAIDRPEHEVMAVLPADHTIADEEAFRGVLAGAERGIARGAFGVDEPLVTLGVQPTYPSTDYGYIRPRLNEGALIEGLVAYPVEGFVEKPDRHRADELFASGGVAWNAGMFLWRRRAIRDALERYTALMTLIDPAAGSDVALAAAYERIKPISVDYAVLEGAARDGRVLMGSMDVGWSDLGGWSALLEALGDGPTEARGRVVEAGESVELGEADLLVQSVDGRLGLIAGPSGTIVPDGPAALLTAARERAGAVQALLDRVAREEATA
ncbi:MAG TPA: mannose-1-phosphate guanylyltransferase [Candidatus Limnocylindrales bacterium]|nr:mannose-1-phosphate guanylyltransferase [Candidatus Limnocylindrales bacterium]